MATLADLEKRVQQVESKAAQNEALIQIALPRTVQSHSNLVALGKSMEAQFYEIHLKLEKRAEDLEKRVKALESDVKKALSKK